MHCSTGPITRRAWIVEDDYDCEFHHRGAPPPALKSLDRSGRVLYVGSFSKVLFPGLRLGYLVVPGALSERFARVARAAQPAPALMTQKLVEAFMSAGHFARHLSRMRSLYTERRKALAAALADAMPQHLEINLPMAGCIWSLVCGARRALSRSSNGCAGGASDRRRCRFARSGEAGPMG